MPALHVIGEIVGASGLRPRDAGSLAHWLDLLSLHPSRRMSFFSRWRLEFRSHDAAQRPTPGTDTWATWRVLQGDPQGQTQAHAWSPLVRLQDAVANGTKNASNSDGVMLEAVWSHPIDLHLALPAVELTSWPYLVFDVLHADEFHQESLVGSAALPVPLLREDGILDLPIVSRQSLSSFDRLASKLGLMGGSQQCRDNDGVNHEGVELESGGILYVNLSVLRTDSFVGGLHP
ncbi:hypothetical protein PINS_up010796 [Pythium insidiosum]|nr:hypothetical protein PINS_up010796 [Pythium insidiosum]